MRLASLHVYPLKGARGISLERADALTGGLRHDRRFLLLDADGKFITQRSHPRLALVTTALSADGSSLGLPRIALTTSASSEMISMSPMNAMTPISSLFFG